MEDVPASWNFPNVARIVEDLHADDAFWSAEFIELFVVLPILHQRDEALIVLKCRLLVYASHRLLLGLTSGSQISKLLRESVPVITLSFGVPIGTGDGGFIVIVDASTQAALQTHHDGTASDAKAAEQNAHQ